jgi:type IV pilus assembly protein PilV
MTERIYANRDNAASYMTSSPAGSGDAQPANCAGLAVGAAKDVCEWSNHLKGAAETSGSSTVGALLGGRGCITQIQVPDPSASVCTPGIYLVSVAWQGLYKTGAQSITCAQGSYGADDAFRRAISAQIVVGMPSCS